MLLSGDNKFWETLEYGLFTNVGRAGKLMMLLNIRADEASYFEDDDRFQEICAQMTSHKRPIVDSKQVERELELLNLIPVKLGEIRDRLLDNGEKAATVNAIWQELHQRRHLILEETWNAHLAKLIGYGAGLTPELEVHALYELRRARHTPLESLKQEFMHRLNL